MLTQQWSPYLIWPQLYALLAITIITSPFHQRSPLKCVISFLPNWVALLDRECCMCITWYGGGSWIRLKVGSQPLKVVSPTAIWIRWQYPGICGCRCSEVNWPCTTWDTSKLCSQALYAKLHHYPNLLDWWCKCFLGNIPDPDVSRCGRSYQYWVTSSSRIAKKIFCSSFLYNPGPKGRD